MYTERKRRLTKGTGCNVLSAEVGLKGPGSVISIAPERQQVPGLLRGVVLRLEIVDVLGSVEVEISGVVTVIGLCQKSSLLRRL